MAQYAMGVQGLSHSSITFTRHHGTWLKTLITGALEASHHVGAGAVPTRVANGALIGIWRKPGPH